MNTTKNKRERGEVLGQVLFSAVLVFGIFCEVLYLTKDLGWRVDLTEENLYSLSGSTKKVLDRVKEPLVIEAYFSSQVPGVYKADRQKISDMLDEYEQLGRGKVKLVYFDPLADESIKDKASRLGITEAAATELKDASLAQVKFFQGLRIRYGGDKQKVLALVQNAATIESQLTPVIRELVTERKPKVGILVRPPAPQNQFMMMQRQQPPAFNYAERVLRGRYEIVTIDLGQGQILPQDLDVAVVIQPKDLTDWEKYSLDQHLMRGGNMVVFQEAADYSVDQFASFYRSPFQVDKPDTKLTWKRQLAAYGVDWSEKMAVDMFPRTWAFALTVYRGAGGSQAIGQMRKPHWFTALPATFGSPDSGQQSEPGIEAGHPILAGMNGLSFFWATEVGLSAPVPEGLEGQVLIRTSPYGLAQDPPPSTAPAQQVPELNARVQREKRQVPLAVALSGKFTSAWKGMDMPQRPLPEKAGDKNGGLWQEKQEAAKKEEGQEATKKAETGPEAGDAAKQGEKAGDAAKQGEKAGDAAKQGEKAGDPAQVGPPAPQGGPDPAKKEEAEKLPDRIDQSEKEGRLLVIGDSSLIRDDFLGGVPPFGVPRSMGGIELYQNALDWLALDTDLVELRNRRDVDRRLEFVSSNSKESQEERKARIAFRKFVLRWLNILGPVVLLLGIGVFIWLKRSAEKRSFLAGQQR